MYTKEQIWDMALIMCANICTDISNKHNDNDEINEAEIARQCSKKIQEWIGAGLPPEITETN